MKHHPTEEENTCGKDNFQVQEGLFDTEHLKTDLRGRSVRGGAVTIAAQGLRFCLGLGSTVVLARLLTPKDFGLIAMVTAITSFVMLFRDIGLSMATVQREEINHGQISTLFWVNVAISFALMLVTAAIAPVIAWFYGEPCLIWVTLALASVFIFGGLTIQHQALLRRQMKFGILAVIEVSAMVIGVTAGIVAACYGLTYWSLVLMQLATPMAIAIGVWLGCRWRPGLPVRNSGVRSMLAFGGHLTGFSLVNYFTRNLDKLLIGRYWGSRSLGFYSKAYSLLLLPLDQIRAPITAVAVPALSRLQKDPTQYCAYYYRGVLLVAMFGMAIVSFLFVTADKVILTVLGSQWTAVVPIFRILAPAAFVGTFSVATGWVYLSLGNVRRQLWVGIASAIVVCIGFAIGVRWGAAGVAAAFSIYLCSSWPFRTIYCFWGTPLRIGKLMGVLWRPVTTSIMAGLLLFLIDKAFPFADVSVVVRLLLNFAEYSLFYTLLWLLLPGGRRILSSVLRLIGELRYQRRTD